MATFAMTLKDELVKQEIDDRGEKILLKALLQVNASINYSSTGLYLDFKSKNESVALKVYELIKKFYNLEPTFLSTKETKLKKEDIFYTRLEQNAFLVLNDLSVLRAKSDDSYNLKKELETDSDRLNYIRGAFLACGSVNDPQSNTYHLEIQCFSTNVAYNLRDLMNSYNLGAKVGENRRGYIVYLKSAETIADFIKILGSEEGLFYFEDHRIEKDLSNSINRVMNCEIANEKKSQEAAKKQLEEIQVVKKFYGSKLKSGIVDVIALRENHPEDSLMDLVEVSEKEIGKTMTKSILNHRFREIHKLYEDIMELRAKNKEQSQN